MTAICLLFALTSYADKAAFSLDSATTPMLMRDPALSRDKIAFSFAGDLWSVARSGGEAVRLTNSAGGEGLPHFSPDGTQIAFTGNYDGNPDVYVMPAAGGEPKRLTFNPQGDAVSGWTPDGKSVVFYSGLLSDTDLARMFTVPASGGPITPLPFPSGTFCSYSDDGKRIAYSPFFHWQDAWKRYRGGQTTPIWIGDLADSKVKEIPRKNSNDSNPMWVGGKVYFLSDRDAGKPALFSYDVQGDRVSKVAATDGFDLKSASEGPGGIVIEQLGGLKLFDTATGKLSDVPVTIHGDFPEVRPQFKPLGESIAWYDISPTGARVVVQSRGDILTVPAAKGDFRNLTQSSGVADRMPAWSPDGKWIAYLSDASGEYQLVLAASDGTGEKKNLALGDAPAYYFGPVWSPDSKKIAYTDNRHNIWIIDVESGKNTKVDTWPYEDPTYTCSPSWSPDSAYMTYHRSLDSHIGAIFVYDVAANKSRQLTDGLSDAHDSDFDRSGNYLYFYASTNVAGATAWLDLSSLGMLNPTSNIYCVVLRKDMSSPFSPESDEEAMPKPKPPEGAAPTTPPAAPKPGETKIDWEGISQRILAVPMPNAIYGALRSGPAGSFFAVERTAVATPVSQARTTLWKFSLDSRSATPFARDINGFSISAKGDKMLIQQGPGLAIVPTVVPVPPGTGALNLAPLQGRVEPRLEWRQIFHEVIRVQRDFFYSPTYHGVNLVELEKKYEPFLDGVMGRSDLNYLMVDMLGELCIGHMNVGGGDIPVTEGVPTGLLGADYSLENGRYRFARVYDGENWNPGLRAPLTQPGINVKAGEYLLEVAGKNVTDKDNVHSFFEGTAGKQVRIKVGPNPDGSGSREVIVVPAGSEAALRRMAWVEDNRRKVDSLSGGKLGYVHVPDTALGGWTFFNRYYYAQLNKDGMVIDERFNHGGQVDDYMVNQMTRPMRSAWTSRYGKDFTSPLAAIFGPKVLLINQFAGSGGDYFPWVFRQANVGPIVGRRTWGGLVGILDFPRLIDGGGVTAPNIAFYNPKGEWDVENWGVPPDVDIEIDPYLWRQGHDVQLERGVAEAMKLVDKTPKPSIKKPAYPDKTKVPPG